MAKKKTMGGRPRRSISHDDVASAPIGKRVSINCEGSRVVALSKLVEFQGELKSLSKEDFAKLRKEILETGYAFPIRVWTDPDNGTEYIIGGHQTSRVLRELESEGYEVPPLPVSDIFAKSAKEAKRRVLQDVSQYGHVDRQGLYQFMIENDFSIGEIASSFKLPDINLPSFGAEFFMDDVTGKVPGMPEPEERKEATGSKEYGAGEFSEFKHECPRCGFNYD